MDLRKVNTEYGEFLAEVRSFHRDREAEVIRLREVGSNYSYWEEQLHMREPQLNGREVNMGEWEADLKVREKRLQNAKVNMESAEDKRYEVSLSYWDKLGYFKDLLFRN